MAAAVLRVPLLKVSPVFRVPCSVVESLTRKLCPNPCAATDGFLGADDDRLGPRRGEYDLTVYIFLRRPTKSSTDEVVVERVVVERASSTSSARRRRFGAWFVR